MSSELLTDTAEAFQKLLNLIATLRSENGCPWDRKQTPATFHPYILEEYHEMVQAMNEGSDSEISDELGDLLFLVIFIVYMFQQEGITTLKKIIEGAVDKMTRRHPHVFGDVQADTPDQVIDNWAKIKASEENIRVRESLLDGIPKSLPALSRAQKLAKRASRLGFDWTRPEEVFAKVDEELLELKEAVASRDPEHTKEELGDLLFVVTNAARLLQINSEVALSETSDKFERRFRHIEARLKGQGRTLEEASLEEMDALWDEAKSIETKR
jgi:MazG family protein